MKRTIRLRQSELRRMISESVRRVLKEGQYSYYPQDLPQILRNMADYAEQCLDEEENIEGYYSEIINTGLFHDSEGKMTDFDNDSKMASLTDDY